MRTARIQLLVVSLLLVIGGVGCGKKLFQSLLDAAPTSVTQYEWRLATSTDARFEAAWTGCRNYIVLKFTSQYQVVSLTVNQGIMQDESKAPRYNYYVVPGTKTMCIDWKQVTNRTARTNTNADLMVSYCEGRASDVFHYRYELKRDGLHLYQIDPKTNQTIGHDHYLDHRPQNPDQCSF